MPQKNSKLRLALVTTYPPGRGTLNEYGYHLVRALRQKYELSELLLLVDELPEGQPYTLEDAPLPVQVVPCWRFGDWRNPLRILRVVHQLQPDAVLFNIQFASFGGDRASAAVGLTTPALVKAGGFPTAVLLHNIMEAVDLRQTGFTTGRLGHVVTRFFGRLLTRVLLHTDFVALTLPRYVEIISEEYGADNVLLTPHGTFEAPEDLRLEEAARPPQVMTFGKFGTYKIVEPLIAAVQALRQRGHANLELVIAGTDSPNTPGYLNRVRRWAGDQPWITYTGYVAEEDVPRLFQEATLVAFPYSSTTGSSGVLHQAGCYGKAVVLPRIGDLDELIAEEGYAGAFFVPDEPESLAGAINGLLADDDQRRLIGERNFLAARSLLIDDVADWFLLHIERIRRGG